MKRKNISNWMNSKWTIKDEQGVKWIKMQNRYTDEVCMVCTNRQVEIYFSNGWSLFEKRGHNEI